MKFIWFLAVLLPPGMGILSAHPHVFIDQAVSLEVKGPKIQGLWVDWTMDEMTTAMMLLDYPAQANGKFSTAAEESLRKAFFKNLATYDFYIHGKWKGTPLPPQIPLKWAVSLKGKALTYQFFYPLDLDWTRGAQLEMTFYDETNFAALTLTGKVGYTGMSSGLRGTGLVNHKTDTFGLPPPMVVYDFF